MSDNGTNRTNPLLEELALLGAVVEDDALGRPEAAYFGDGATEPEAFENGCALADMGGLAALYISGEGAEGFCSAVFTAEPPVAGSLAWSLALMGDGTVVAPVLLAGTAPGEWCAWSAPETAEGLAAWLEGIRSIEQDGVAPYATVEVGPGAPFSTMLMVAGPKAEAVLEDYVPTAAALPAPGTIANVMLDAIPTVMLRPTVGGDAPWLALVPDPKVRVLWRSLLSFETVIPVGSSAVWGRVERACPGAVAFLDDPRPGATPADLGLERLLRPEGGFIGARALGIGE